MNYQKMRIDFTQKRGLTAPFVYKTGEIDVDGIEAELVNIDVEGSPIGFIKLISPTGIERESALRIENGFAYFDIPKNEEGLYTVELTILNKKNKTRSGNIAIEVINSLSYDSEEYETLLDTITKHDAEYTTNENIRIENENARIKTFDEIKTDFENLTVGKQLDSEVIIARSGKASLKDNIESKRDKSVLLTQSDLSTSSESHKLTMNHLSQEVKNAMTGTAPVSPNIEDGQITTEKIANKAINSTKFYNIKTDNYNVFDRHTCPYLKDKYVDTVGNIQSSGGRVAFLLAVKPETVYTFSESTSSEFGVIAFYDSSDVKISTTRYTSSNVFCDGIKVLRVKTPTNTATMRFSAVESGVGSDFGSGVIVTEGERFFGNKKSTLTELDTFDFKLNNSAHKITMSRENLVSKSARYHGFIIDSNGAQPTVSNGHVSFVTVKPNTTYTFWRKTINETTGQNAGATAVGGMSILSKLTRVAFIAPNSKTGVYKEFNYYTFTTPEDADTFGFTTRFNETIVTSCFLIEGDVVEQPRVLEVDGGVILHSEEQPYVHWTVLGDSLTEVNSSATTRYHDYVSKDLGYTVSNFGSGGTGYKRGWEANRAFYQRAVNINTETDLITIFGSFNDLGGGFAIGEATDTGIETICGCMNETLKVIKTKCPKAKIGIITPTAWNDRTTADTTNSREYVDKLIEVAELHNLPVLDLWRTSGMRPNDTLFKQNFYSKDNGNGVHPDENGHKFFYTLVREFVKGLI